MSLGTHQRTDVSDTLIADLWRHYRLAVNNLRHRHRKNGLDPDLTPSWDLMLVRAKECDWRCVFCGRSLQQIIQENQLCFFHLWGVKKERWQSVLFSCTPCNQRRGRSRPLSEFLRESNVSEVWFYNMLAETFGAWMLLNHQEIPEILKNATAWLADELKNWSLQEESSQNENQEDQQG